LVKYIAIASNPTAPITRVETLGTPINAPEIAEPTTDNF
jgi:hypothetical protein